MSTQLPAAPNPVIPARKKSHAKAWILGGITAAVVISAASSMGNTPGTSSTTDNSGSTSITPAMVVDAAGPATEAKFCEAYRFLGPEAAWTAYDQGFTSPDKPGLPTAREIFEEAASRC